MVSIPGVEEARTKARTNRPDYIQEALDKTAELIREASETGNKVVKIDLTTVLPGLDQTLDEDKFSLALAHLKMELNSRGYILRDYERPVLPENGDLYYEIKRGFFVYWGWGPDDD